MPSIFPGMDPYLEDPAFWPDFHATLIPCLREAIADRLPPKYVARVREQIRIIDLEAGEAVRYEPDVNIAQTIETRELLIEIIHRPANEPVTAIEVLSPSNKGKDADEYVVKRRQLLKDPGNDVEIDLLLGGDRPPLREPWPAGDYHVLIARRKVRGKAMVISWGQRHAIPAIPIPLKAPDPDIVVPLAEVFALTFDRGRYARELNYDSPPKAPLHPDDLGWAAELTAARAK